MTRLCPKCQQPSLSNAGSSRNVVRCDQCGSSWKIKPAKQNKQQRSSDTKREHPAAEETLDQPPSGQALSEPAPLAASEHATQDSKSAANRNAGRTELGCRGRFRLDSVLGEGAFGRVYLAFDPQLDRAVALKVPTFPRSDRGRLTRFQREAKTAAKLRHPNIVPTFESGTVDGVFFIASQFVRGETLAARLRREKPSLQLVAQWTEQLAQALAYAHDQGIIHRDIKPENIMIDEQGEPQIMDFGLAKRNDGADLTIAGKILGTPAYMAPEQARGEDTIGPSCDQYALGSVLYEMLTGQRPYQGPMHVVLTGVADPDQLPQSPRSLVPNLPKDLNTICQKAMSKEVKDRYASCHQLAEDLNRWRHDLPIMARRIGPWEKTARFVRHNPVVSGLIVCLVLALIATQVLFAEARFLSAVRSSLEEEKTQLSNDVKQLEDKKTTLEKEKASSQAKALLAQRDIASLEGKIQSLEQDEDNLLQEVQDLELRQTNLTKKIAGLQKEVEVSGRNAEREKGLRQRQQYINAILEAEKHLSGGDFPATKEALEGCDAQSRGWEWQYLQQASTPVLSVPFESNVLDIASLHSNAEAGIPPRIFAATANGIFSIDPAKPAVKTLLSESQIDGDQARKFEPFRALEIDPFGRYLKAQAYSLRDKGRTWGICRVWDCGRIDDPPQSIRASDSCFTFCVSPGRLPAAALVNIASGLSLRESFLEIEKPRADIGFETRWYGSQRNPKPRDETWRSRTIEGGPSRMRLGVCGDFKFRGDNVVIPRLTEPLILSKDRLRKIHYSNLLDPNRLAIETDSDVEFLNYRNRVSLQKFNSAAVGRFINMSRDGRVAAFSKNEYIDVYDVDKGKFQFRPAAGQLAELFGDGSLVIVADDKQLSVYNLQHPQFFSTGHDGLIGFALSSDPDGYYVATCDTESIRLFDHFRKERFKRNFSIDHASCLAFGGNERLFAVGKLPSLKTWEVPSGRALATTELTPHHQNPISAIGVSPDGRRIVTGDIAGQVQLWAVQPNAAAVWLKKLSTDVQNDAGNRIASSIPINKLAFLDNKHVVAVCKAASPDQPGCIFRWNLDSPEEAERDEYEALSVAKADSNSDMIAAGTTTGRLHLKPSTPVPFDTEITFEDEPIIDLAFHPHQPRLAILSARDLRLLDTERGDQVLSVRCPLTAPSQIEFTPDGNGIVVSDSQRGDLWLLRAVPE